MPFTDIAKPVHASCVAVDGRAALIVGDSGAGKSSMALTLMAYGALLVSDDRVQLTRSGDKIRATAPSAISGMIEARGIGILNADAVASAHVVVVVDLSQSETDRLPEFRSVLVNGVSLPLLHRVEALHFGPAILQYLRAGRSDP